LYVHGEEGCQTACGLISIAMLVSRCWVGKKQLDTAMNHLSGDFEFHVQWKPFLLNSFIPEQGIPVVDYFKLKFGEEAAARFMSGSSPLSMQARTLVRIERVYCLCIQLQTT
jgi:predicted DsbA family dithiol-disulfide isomerase